MNAPLSPEQQFSMERAARQAQVVRQLQTLVPEHALLWHNEDTTAYECDGLTAYRQRPLAVTSPQRRPDLPNVPTIAESGYPGFEAPAWWAVLAPSKTPPDILKRMNEALNTVLKNPDIAKKLDAQGIDVVGGSADAARLFIDKQMDIWAKVVKDNNIKAD